MPEASNKELMEGLSTEYYKIVGIVSDFDKNLLTVKGWGVTLGLAALAWGFQNQHYGLFLVACISGVAFWIIEAVMKRHQMRYYVRMREIEVIGSALSEIKLPDGSPVSTPAIDWGWEKATEAFKGGRKTWSSPERYEKKISFALTWLLPHVFLPHAITVAMGGLLFVLGVMDFLKMPL
jgi:hypothetical protein